jgi:polyketide biosynthesis enoyl-CoA hydratase PksH
LPEALWGLLPCCVAPYLIRRIGFQNAYRMALTTLPILAARAREIGLVDEMAESLDPIVRQLSMRLGRLQSTAIGELKRYFRKLWLITEQIEDLAVTEITRLTSSPDVQANIRNFVNGARFPWDSPISMEP